MQRERTIATKSPRCRTPQCTNDATRRGVCDPCYQVAWRLVKDGLTTWKELEDRGKVDRFESKKSWFLNIA